MIDVFIEQQVFHIQDTDDMIGRFFINRHSCIVVFPVNFQDFMVGAVRFYKCHIDPRGHNFSCKRIGKIKYIVDHFTFFCFNHAAFMADVHDCFQLFFCHHISAFVRIYPQQKQKQV